MSRFFVGQRVRLVRTPGYAANNPNGLQIGDQGTVSGTELSPNEGFHIYRGGEVNLSVTLDRIGRPMMGPSFRFEPILPDGHKSADESIEEILPCLFEKERETA